MKRSKSINLSKMRKSKPVGLAIAGSLVLTACGSNEPEQQATIFRTQSECVQQNPQYQQQCIDAYEKAVREAEVSAPRYSNQNQCEQDFGYNRCVQSRTSNWFMPAMAGFMLGRMLDNRSRYDYYRPEPVYVYNNGWVGGNGRGYGSSNYRSTTVPEKTFKSPPKKAKTISRNGFGSTVHAKSSWGKTSSWGGSSSRSSYGG